MGSEMCIRDRLKDKLHDQALAYSLVTVEKQHLSSLNTHIQNVQYVVNQLAVTDPSETETHTALVEELTDREDQLSRFVGSLFHSNELNMSAIINPNLGGGSQNETIKIYDSDAPNANIIGEIAAIEVNFSKIFETLHSESTCPHCIALALSLIHISEPTRPY